MTLPNTEKLSNKLPNLIRAYLKLPWFPKCHKDCWISMKNVASYIFPPDFGKTNKNFETGQHK